ncbi:MAG TPA: ABC transporter permease, partial [Cyclobacteriaceae bacterium]
MLYHNLLLVYRSFQRFRNTFFINLIGLSSGLACTILIYLWISDEINFDKFHKNDHRLFQVMENEQTTTGIKTNTGTPDFLAKTLKDEMPEIEMADVATPADFFPPFTLSDSKKHVKGMGKFAGENFFSIFSYNLFRGNDQQVLKDKNAVVLSERLANSLFGSTDVVGKTVEWEMMDIKREVLITGVYHNVPVNSSEQFDFVLSFESFKDIMRMSNDANWNQSGPFDTYVVLKDAINVRQLNTKLADLISIKTNNAQHRSLFVRPYSDKYLYADYENGVQSGGRIDYVLLFSTLAILILVIACINFMNLFTAKVSRRAKDVGIKKVIGAKRSSLVIQYFTESMVMAFISLFIAIIIVNLALPQFNEISGKQLELHFNIQVLASIVGLTLLTGLIAGVYPAFYLSAFDIAAVLKGQVTTSLRDAWVRKGLVVVQFSITIILIVTVLVVHKQIEFLQTQSIGYNKENV